MVTYMDSAMQQPAQPYSRAIKHVATRSTM